MSDTLVRPPDLEWLDQAACKDKDPHIFFPPRANNSTYAWRPARIICNDCPVRAECLDDALHWEERLERSGHKGRSGMFGGLTPGERERVTEQRRGERVYANIFGRNR